MTYFNQTIKCAYAVQYIVYYNTGHKENDLFRCGATLTSLLKLRMTSLWYSISIRWCNFVFALLLHDIVLFSFIAQVVPQHTGGQGDAVSVPQQQPSIIEVPIPDARAVPLVISSEGILPGGEVVADLQTVVDPLFCATESQKRRQAETPGTIDASTLNLTYSIYFIELIFMRMCYGHKTSLIQNYSQISHASIR